MIDRIQIAYFKAFDDGINIYLNNKNLLLYGENGSGKTSIYEALKVIFYHDRIESPVSANTPEDLEQLRRELWNSYNNKIASRDFELKINDLNYQSINKSNIQVFMISIEDHVIGSKLNLKSLLKKYYLPTVNIDEFCQEYSRLIQGNVNLALGEFIESVTIEIVEEDDYDIVIIDTKKSLTTKIDIRKFFNEAKLNLIVLLILLSFIELLKEKSKSKILVLDDFITSLDTSNRSFLTKYIIRKFSDTQVIILTHNISFYNLIMYTLNLDTTATNWVFGNLFEINNKHKLYIQSEIEDMKKISDDFNAIPDQENSASIEGIGNRIRKRFEILLYEYSKLIMIGAVEDASKIIERIRFGKPAFYYQDNTASDLVDKIDRILQNPSSSINLKNRIQTEINRYKIEDFENFRKIINELKLYQKVTMHPLSHGVNGLPTFTIREINKSLELLEKMEKYISEKVKNNVVTV